MPQYFVLNKPPGCIVGRTDPEGRATVYDHVPPHFPPLPHVGRLDYNSEGLLLFCDDGPLARALLDSQAGPAERPPIPKVYAVKLRDRMAPDAPALLRLQEPLDHPDGPTRPAALRVLGHRSRATWVELTLLEGRHHQIRLLCARSELQVVKLRRVALGPLRLDDLPLRRCRPLSLDERDALYAAALPGQAPPPFLPIDDSPAAYARARAERAAALPLDT